MSDKKPPTGPSNWKLLLETNGYGIDPEKLFPIIQRRKDGENTAEDLSAHLNALESNTRDAFYRWLLWFKDLLSERTAEYVSKISELEQELAETRRAREEDKREAAREYDRLSEQLVKLRDDTDNQLERQQEESQRALAEVKSYALRFGRWGVGIGCFSLLIGSGLGLDRVTNRDSVLATKVEHLDREVATLVALDKHMEHGKNMELFRENETFVAYKNEVGTLRQQVQSMAWYFNRDNKTSLPRISEEMLEMKEMLKSALADQKGNEQ